MEEHVQSGATRGEDGSRDGLIFDPAGDDRRARESSAAILHEAASHGRSGIGHVDDRGGGGGDRWAHRRVEPRGLALVWTMYLLACTVIAFGAPAARGTLDTLSSRFAARELLVLVGVGIAILWPTMRLCQSFPAEGGVRSVAKDLIVILLPSTAVVLPMSIMAAWPLFVALGLASATVAWTLCVGAVLAVALSPGSSTRSEGGAGRRALFAGLFALAMGLPAVLAWSRPELDSRAADLVSCMALPGMLVEIARDRHWSGQAASVLFEHWVAILVISVFAVSAWLIAAGLLDGQTRRE